MNKRKFEDLSDLDKGAAVCLSELNKHYEEQSQHSPGHRYQNGLSDSIEIIKECLDVATLGDIDFEGSGL